jgi:hypothetical protein
MKFFDAGQHATGFIAVGQEATGFFAFGQVATGVVAVGQLARGGFVVGQLAVGLVGWGQAGLGVYHAAGMVGVGGRRGFGLVVPLVPSIGRPRVLPPITPLEAVDAGGEGWVEVELAEDGGVLGLYRGGQRLPIKLDRRLQKRALEISAEGPRRVLAYTRRVATPPGEPILVCDRIAHEPPRPYRRKGFAMIASLQIAALLALGVVYAAVAGDALARFLFGPDASALAPPMRGVRPPRRR